MKSELDAFLKILEEQTDRPRVVAAAQSLSSSSAALVGSPPRQLMTALIEGGPGLEQPLLDLARAWSRPEMSRAMLDALGTAETVGEREQAAWLLKTVLAVEHGAEVIDRVLDDDEDAQVRRWLVEALERLAFGSALGWQELGRVVTRLAGERHRPLRVALPSLLSALPWRSENAALLEELLRDDDHEIVSAAAHTLARHPEAALTLSTTTLDRLKAHANPMMKHSGAVLEEARRTARARGDTGPK